MRARRNLCRIVWFIFLLTITNMNCLSVFSQLPETAPMNQNLKLAFIVDDHGGSGFKWAVIGYWYEGSSEIHNISAVISQEGISKIRIEFEIPKEHLFKPGILKLQVIISDYENNVNTGEIEQITIFEMESTSRIKEGSNSGFNQNSFPSGTILMLGVLFIFLIVVIYIYTQSKKRSDYESEKTDSISNMSSSELYSRFNRKLKTSKFSQAILPKLNENYSLKRLSSESGYSKKEIILCQKSLIKDLITIFPSWENTGSSKITSSEQKWKKSCPNCQSNLIFSQLFKKVDVFPDIRIFCFFGCFHCRNAEIFYNDM